MLLGQGVIILETPSPNILCEYTNFLLSSPSTKPFEKSLHSESNKCNIEKCLNCFTVLAVRNCLDSYGHMDLNNLHLLKVVMVEIF